MRDLFSFPKPLNEKAARVVAGVLCANVAAHVRATVNR